MRGTRRCAGSTATIRALPREGAGARRAHVPRSSARACSTEPLGAFAVPCSVTERPPVLPPAAVGPRLRAHDDPIARQMVNFVYLIGDRETGEAVVVDPGLRHRRARRDRSAPTACGSPARSATHYHPDHVGGSMMGYAHRGHRRAARPTTSSADPRAAPTRRRGCSASPASSESRPRRCTTSGDTVMVGEIPISSIHTPGHTPGSQCFLVDGRLVAGDTLFLEGCGRTDLPGGDPDALYESLTQRLAEGARRRRAVSPATCTRAEPSATMGETRAATTSSACRPSSSGDMFMGRERRRRDSSTTGSTPRSARRSSDAQSASSCSSATASPERRRARRPARRAPRPTDGALPRRLASTASPWRAAASAGYDDDDRRRSSGCT